MYANRLGQQENIKYTASGGVWGKHSKPKKKSTYYIDILIQHLLTLTILCPFLSS
jgi:hypothetical protein